jgi:hypothetical protein
MIMMCVSVLPALICFFKLRQFSLVSCLACDSLRLVAHLLRWLSFYDGFPVATVRVDERLNVSLREGGFKRMIHSLFSSIVAICSGNVPHSTAYRSNFTPNHHRRLFSIPRETKLISAPLLSGVCHESFQRVIRFKFPHS